MQNISVYLNKRASNGSEVWVNEIRNALFRSHIEFNSPKDLEELYQKLDDDINAKISTIMSVGGDGTAHTIIQKIAGTDVGLVVVPGGTANDLAKSLGASSNVRKIAQSIRHQNIKKIDLIDVNGTFMATNGGLGFAAEVAQEINDLRKSFSSFKTLMKFSGENIYSIFLAKKLLSKEIKSYKFKLESKEFNSIFYAPLVLINNQPILGGAYEVAPHTSNQDGYFNVTILKHENRIELIQCLIRILNGKLPKNDKNFISFETKEIKLSLLDQNESLSFFGDGETFSKGSSWTIKCRPNLLNVFFSNEEENALESSASNVALLQ